MVKNDARYKWNHIALRVTAPIRLFFCLPYKYRRASLWVLRTIRAGGNCRLGCNAICNEAKHNCNRWLVSCFPRKTTKEKWFKFVTSVSNYYETCWEIGFLIICCTGIVPSVWFACAPACWWYISRRHGWSAPIAVDRIWLRTGRGIRLLRRNHDERECLLLVS